MLTVTVDFKEVERMVVARECAGGQWRRIRWQVQSVGGEERQLQGYTVQWVTRVHNDLVQVLQRSGRGLDVPDT